MLFGSYARESYTEYSDISLCVISNRLSTDIVKRRTITTGMLRISAIRFTDDEIFRMIDELNPLILDVICYEKPIVGEGVYRRLKEEIDDPIDRGVIERYKDGYSGGSIRNNRSSSPHPTIFYVTRY
ncbi:MAG: nucleotidyltransferase domain-containing protein [Candidatus Bathyarchaeia archaeon]